MKLDGKVALVTGAGSGIGYAIAQRFAAAGASVVVDHRGHDDDAVKLAAELSARGAKAIEVGADVSVKSEVDAMIERIVSELGGLDILVNNAGVEESTPFLEITEESWDRIVSIDLKGAFLCAQAAARAMKQRGGGAIVNISSVHEDFPFPGFTSYCASKGGLRMMMRNAALELAQYGIRVNNIAPGAIATPINAATLKNPAKLQRIKEIVPLQRMGRPEEVAEVALFLASDSSSYVTGSTYYADGGLVRYAEPI
ncbi:MAG: SDR family NAD(P)-dependent oxidoreductase [Candidatus Dormibacteria bacterium]